MSKMISNNTDRKNQTMNASRKKTTQATPNSPAKGDKTASIMWVGCGGEYVGAVRGVRRFIIQTMGGLFALCTMNRDVITTAPSFADAAETALFSITTHN